MIRPMVGKTDHTILPAVKPQHCAADATDTPLNNSTLMEHKLIKVIKAIILTENRITLHHAPKEKI